MAKAQLEWQNLNIDDCGANIKKAWAALEAAKDAFEAEVEKGVKKSGGIKDGQSLKFAYRHGVAFAVTDGAAARKTVSF